jgi:hypothetical protein
VNDSNKYKFDLEKIERLNSGNACYHSVRNLLFCRLLSKKVKIIIYNTIILPVVLYLISDIREEHNKTKQNKQTPWSESASELYRASDRHLSAKWLPTFANRGCHVVSVTSLRPYSRFSRQESLLFYQVAPQLDPVPNPLIFFIMPDGNPEGSLPPSGEPTFCSTSRSALPRYLFGELFGVTLRPYKTVAVMEPPNIPTFWVVNVGPELQDMWDVNFSACRVMNCSQPVAARVTQL